MPAEARRRMLCDVKSRTFATQLEPGLANKIATMAGCYAMTRSQFICAILDAVDDGNMYSKLLGPLEEPRP